MPEMTFTVRWPDGTTPRYYSPSLVMHDHLTAGSRYAVPEFVDRSRSALTEASDRVRARYGFACTSAAATLEEIIDAAAGFDSGSVEILAMTGTDVVERERSSRQ
ncbi:hypothetical protein GCM10007304_03210 [Rhodococcoides trifolii]|uniref:MSMEG_0570 family nitrogen starvation response protein n=1 Tax=Rhodococcoides trifolii TaxID=908250 RepID=A0A917FPG6_9NOCA|nr:MSMEG_0570 family nitrogen starvation response protein [Rhodococcus trifolii]GGF92749.1 hypothetical protein GCM10007304_03210 [Rhodococcus trifolii]